MDRNMQYVIEKSAIGDVMEFPTMKSQKDN